MGGQNRAAMLAIVLGDGVVPDLASIGDPIAQMLTAREEAR
jgi:hypothetical protein